MVPRFELISQKYTPRDVEKLGVKEVNVVIPAHNSQLRIKGVLANLAAQPLPGSVRMRVVVCANACEDATAEQAKTGLRLLKKRRPNAETGLIVTSVQGQAQAINTMVNNLGNPSVVIESHDDSFAEIGGVACLAAAMAVYPELGAISLPPIPIPTYRSRYGTPPERVAHMNLLLTHSGQNIIIDRFCAFRPGVVGEIPNIASVDLYMVSRAISLAGGYGVFDPRVSAVYHRVPTTWLELLRQRMTYVQCTRQILMQSPDLLDRIGDLFQPIERPSKLTKLVMHLRGQSEVALVDRVASLVLIALERQMVRLQKVSRPLTTSLRYRIKSSV